MTTVTFNLLRLQKLIISAIIQSPCSTAEQKKITIQRQHKKYPPSINVLFHFRRRRDDDDVKGQEGKKSILLSRNINQRRRRPAASFFSPVFP